MAHYLSALAAKLRGLFGDRRAERELDEEIEAHIRLLAERYIRQGMSEAEAEWAARRQFGNVTLLQEEHRDMRGIRLIDTFFQDVRYGLRMLRKNPGFAFIAALTLGLGIGANTAIFSVVNAVLLRPLPYHRPDQLVLLWGNILKLNIEHLGSKAAEYLDYKTRSKSFDQVAAYTQSDLTLTEVGEPESVPATVVTANLFPMIGAKPLMGRLIQPEDMSSDLTPPTVVVLSYGFWQRRFGGEQNILGKKITLDGSGYTVVGVMPAGFQFPHESMGGRVDLWAPLSFRAEQIANREGPYYLNVIARLKPDVTLEQARADMNAIGRWMEENIPTHYRGPNNEDGEWRITVVPIMEELAGRSRLALLVLSAAVGFLLLLACANVANLLLVRAAVRQKELAIRAALGASRFALVRQLLLESLLIAVLAGATGLALARWGVDLLVWLKPGELPRLNEINLDGRVLMFTIGLSVLTGLVFGLIPAIQASKPELQKTLKENSGSVIGASGRARLRNLLVAGEVAIALVLLAGAGLFVNSFLRLQRVNPGVDAGKVLTTYLALSGRNYAEPERQAAFYKDLLRGLETAPGVEAAGVSSLLPLNNYTPTDPLAIEGRPIDPNRLLWASWQIITPDYFRTLGIPILRGRGFAEGDNVNSPRVAIINETMAHTYWPNEDPLGKRILFGGPGPTPNNPWATIIGVVRDIPTRAVDSKPEPDWYLSQLQTYRQRPIRNMTLFVRTTINPVSFGATLRRVVSAVDRDQPLTEITTLSQVIASTTAPRRFNTLLLGIFAGIALLLAAFGIYSVIAYSVEQRAHEIGVRMALGAQAGDVMRLVIKQGMAAVLLGLVAGLIAALALTRFMTTLLYEVSATDPLTFGLIAALLIIVAMLACYVPARRATKLDPLLAIRHE